jgi:predicted ATP-binding protein involved in virulence
MPRPVLSKPTAFSTLDALPPLLTTLIVYWIGSALAVYLALRLISLPLFFHPVTFRSLLTSCLDLAFKLLMVGLPMLAVIGIAAVYRRVSLKVQEVTQKEQEVTQKEQEVTQKEQEVIRRQQEAQEVIELVQRVQSVDIQNSIQKKKDLDEANYRNNLRLPPYVEYISIKNHVMFEGLRWNLEQTNVLLGRNGFGKTLLLRILTALLSNDGEKIADILGANPARLEVEIGMARALRAADSAKSRIAYADRKIIHTIAPVPFLAIPDIRTLSRAEMTLAPPPAGREDLARYGYYNFLYDLPTDSLVQRTLLQACIDSVGRKPGDVPLLQLLQNIITELSGASFRFDKITPLGSGGRFRIDVIAESSSEAVPLQVVSQGTLSTTAIFGLIYDYLRWQPPTGSPVERMTGIVLIDELDAHLHPAWQQKILELLRRTFPNVQLICTAHSPLIVAGRRMHEVALLAKDEEHFTVENIARDFVGTGPEEILRAVFKVEDKDEAFNRYRAMRPRRASIEAEINELSSGSDADLRRIEKLEQDLNYIDKAEAVQVEINKIAMLRDRVKELEHRRKASEANLGEPTT